MSPFPTILAYLRLYLSCTTYNSILLLHDNRSSDLASTILNELSPVSNGVWLPTNLDIFKLDEINEKRAILYRNPLLLVLNVIEGSAIAETYKNFRRSVPIKDKCDNFIVTLQSVDQKQITDIIKVVNHFKVVNIGILYEAPNGLFGLIKLHYEWLRSWSIEIVEPYCHHIRAHLFYDKTLEWVGRELVIRLFFEVPRVINLTQHSNRRSIHYVGGRDAYFTTLIDYRFGTQSRRVAKVYPPKFIADNYLMANFFLEFMEKPYREDNGTPNKLAYAVVKQENWDK